VAVEDESVIGAGGGGVTEPGVGDIFVLYLDPTRRGEGIGTLILDAITEQQRAQGAREQWVSVEPTNKKGRVASKYAASGPNGGTTPEEGRISLRLMRRLRLSSPPQDRSPAIGACQDAAKSTSFASTVPAVRPGASWLPQ
jgi:GNAT superfamily N-acetyltransferase